MSLAELVYQTVKPLPEATVQEVLDFALFLRQREEKSEWQNLMFAQASSLNDWDNDEDEVWNDVPVFSRQKCLCSAWCTGQNYQYVTSVKE